MQSWGYSGKICGLSWAGVVWGPPWDNFGGLGGVGSPLGFRVEGVKFDHQNAYLFEMQASLSPYACAAKAPT